MKISTAKLRRLIPRLRLPIPKIGKDCSQVDNARGKLICNGYTCEFADGVRTEIAIIQLALTNIRDRIGAFEGYLDRIATTVQVAHQDTVEIKHALRVLHGDSTKSHTTK